jgi:phosphoserine phosphatase RsbU/P
MTINEAVVDVSQDWVAACDVQRRFMGGTRPINSSLVYSARCRQARALGGDCYDFIPLTDNRLGLMIGDASGKGLPAALMMANVQSSLRAASFFSANDLPALFKVVNHIAYGSSLAERYATVFYGVFDGAANTLRYVNAGHNAPFILRRNSSVEWLETGGAPIGLFADWDYQEGLLKLEAGDVVIAFTDGVIEATNRRQEEWGVKGLLKAASCAAWETNDADDCVARILTALNDFSGEQQADDETLAVVRVI